MKNNITEDYVNFEIAKLLKDKGFDESCYLGYNKNGEYFPTGNRNNSQIIQPDFCFICCPTLQMAMKWLMEVHKLYVNVCPSVESYYWTEKWHSYVEELEKRSPFGRFIGTFNSHEQACEEAIKYCLENLI